MTILYFGTYQENYSINQIIIYGLKRLDITVLKCHQRKPKIDKFDLLNKFIFIMIFPFSYLYRNVYLFFNALFFYITKKYDFIFVGFPGHLDIPLAFLIGKITRKPIVFFQLISLYDTYVLDRKIFDKHSLIAKILFVLEINLYKLCDFIIVDTQQNKDFMSFFFSINDSKIIVSYVGADQRLYYPNNTSTNRDLFEVLYFGNYIPLHGTKYIIDAAKELKKRKIKFTMIGEGQEFKLIKNMAEKNNLTNIKFLPYQQEENLNFFINRADVLLGIFDNGSKANRVIPNKVFQSIAVKKPVITARTPAILEQFTNKKNILLCKAASGNDLAKKILTLVESKEYRNSISEEAYNIYLEKFTPKIICENLLLFLK